MSTPQTPRKVPAWVWVVGILAVLAVIGAISTAGGTREPPSVAYKLSAIDVGDGSEEAAFQDAIDCIQASGIKGAETEMKVGDTLVASWEAGGKPVSLLEWAQVLCSS